MSLSYTLYIKEPESRNLDAKVDPEGAQWQRLEDAFKIDGFIQSLVEDLADLLPAGYTIESVKESE